MNQGESASVGLPPKARSASSASHLRQAADKDPPAEGSGIESRSSGVNTSRNAAETSCVRLDGEPCSDRSEVLTVHNC